MGASQTKIDSIVDVTNKAIAETIIQSTQSTLASQGQQNVIEINQAVCGSNITIDQTNQAVMTVHSLQKLKTKLESESEMDTTVENIVAKIDKAFANMGQLTKTDLNARTTIVNDAVSRMLQQTLNNCMYDQGQFNVVRIGQRITEEGTKAKIKRMSDADLRKKLVNIRLEAPSSVRPGAANASNNGNGLANPNLEAETAGEKLDRITLEVGALPRNTLETEFLGSMQVSDQCIVSDSTLVFNLKNMADFVGSCTQDIVTDAITKLKQKNDVSQKATAESGIDFELIAIVVGCVIAVMVVGSIMMKSRGRRQTEGGYAPMAMPYGPPPPMQQQSFVGPMPQSYY